MGATEFRDRVAGNTAREAFASAVQAAQHRSGHEGYTGTVAEKPGFRVFTAPSGVDPDRFVEAIESFHAVGNTIDDALQAHVATIKRAAELHYDKWDDAVCVPMGDGTYTFMGMASC